MSLARMDPCRWRLNEPVHELFTVAGTKSLVKSAVKNGQPYQEKKPGNTLRNALKSLVETVKKEENCRSMRHLPSGVNDRLKITLQVYRMDKKGYTMGGRRR